MPKALSVQPDQLEQNPWNSNSLTPENEAKLDEALRRRGFIKPIVVRERAGHAKYQILGGEHRWHSAKRLGLTEVPIFNLGQISDQEAKEVSVLDNARYGADDALQFAAILEELGKPEELQEFLPYTDTDIAGIFSSVNIALDELDLDENFDAPSEKPEDPIAKAPKTHAFMRFKVPLSDSERISELIAKVQKRHGYTAADELTNAGDALVHLLLGDAEPA